MAAAPIPEPILSWNVLLADPNGNAEPGCEDWKPYGQHQIWIGRYPASAPRLYLQEMHPQGWVQYDKSESFMHRVPAGLPYRVGGLFGFWHLADSDVTWLHFVRGPIVFYVAIAGGTTDLAGSHVAAWYCAQCKHEIYRQEFPRAGDTGRFLTRGVAEAIAAFNADPARRRCPACGWEHPPAYPFTPWTPEGEGQPSW